MFIDIILITFLYLMLDFGDWIIKKYRSSNIKLIVRIFELLIIYLIISF